MLIQKLLLLAALPFCSAAASAQDTLTYAMAQNIDYTKNIKNGTEYKVYVCKDGSILRVGDTVKIVEPSGGELTTVSGLSTKTKREYQYIYLGHYTLGKALLVTPSALTNEYRNEVCVIDAFRVQHTKLSRESPVNAMIYLHNPTSPKGLGIQNRTVHNFEMALEAGEVRNPKRAMTRSEAIAKLKETKDLLELGIVKPDEYETLKSKLTPIIMQQK